MSIDDSDGLRRFAKLILRQTTQIDDCDYDKYLAGVEAVLRSADSPVAALTARCRELEARLDRMKELQRFTEDNEIHWMREHEALAARCATLEARVKADE